MTQGDHIYRLIDAEKGVMIRRVPVDSPWWSHGVISQFYADSRQFRMTIVGEQVKYLNTVDEAVQIIKEQKWNMYHWQSV